jgi:hypothetical protein
MWTSRTPASWMTALKTFSRMAMQLEDTGIAVEHVCTAGSVEHGAAHVRWPI